MMQRIREARQNEDGFTLIELLIVIVVLGILAGIVVLGLGTFRADSQVAACNADAKQVQIASDAFMASPSNATGAVVAGADSAARVNNLVTAKLLQSAPSAVNLAKIDLTATGAVTDTC